MKRKWFHIIFLTGIISGLAGCASAPSFDPSSIEENTEAAQMQDKTGLVTIGHVLEIDNTNKELTLLENKDILASDGLYYAAWTMGDAKPYENSDGETIDLYDAQLYLLLQEFSDGESALNNKEAWLAAAQSNYEVTQETEADYNGAAYTILTYNCIGENNPYARGISAFSTFENNAVCIELTCLENFEKELEPVLVDFLEHCSYVSD